MSALFPATVPAESRHWIRPSGCLIAVTAIHALLVALVFRGTVFLPSDQSASVVPVSVEMIVTEENPQNIATTHPTPAETRDATKPPPPVTPSQATATNARSQLNPTASSGSANDVRSSRFHTPPSATLQYTVQARQKGQDHAGDAHIVWQSSERTYSIQGRIILQQKLAQAFNSEGVMDPVWGMAPQIYTEQSQDTRLASTHFHRQQMQVRFGANHAPVSLRGGEQDRASLIWQLVRMGREGNKLFAPSARFMLAVAGKRNVAPTQILVVGPTEVDTTLGKLTAWQLTLTPDSSSDAPTLDLWLAPGHDWYPVGLRYTYPNGDTLELRVKEITPISGV